MSLLKFPYGTHTVQVPYTNGVTLNVPNKIQFNPSNPFTQWDKSLLDRWGKIVMLSELECGAPWEVYVETLGPALLNMYLTVIAPGALDILKARLNHSYNCGFKKLFKDLEKHLPVPRADGKAFLFRIIGPVEGVLWYYFLADAFTEFVLNWETAILQRQECGFIPGSGPCQLSNAGNSLFIKDTYFPMNWHQRDNDPSGWAAGGTPWNPIAPNFPGSYKTYGSCSFTNNSAVAQSVSLKIDRVDGKTVAGPNTVTIGAHSSSANILYGTDTAVTSTLAQYQMFFSISENTGSAVQASGGSFTVARA